MIKGRFAVIVFGFVFTAIAFRQYGRVRGAVPRIKTDLDRFEGVTGQHGVSSTHQANGVHLWVAAGFWLIPNQLLCQPPMRTFQGQIEGV